MERTWNSQEKFAHGVIDPESNPKTFVLNGKTADEHFEIEARNKYNDQVDEYVKKLDDHNQALQDYAKQFNESAGNMEIKAIGFNALVLPLDTNPFQHMKKLDSGLIIDLGGMTPTYKSNETGEVEEEEQFIHVGTVFDAGPECKYLKDGDFIMWTKPSEMPVPFYGQGLVMVPETRVICVINSNLTERFKK